ncbi:FGGY-family carbohydrate kinase [Leptolyngbya sp. PCC 6406]|uniref:FGGY-family carbohydrate kinase n=1 Tax=Leptolyngbya sp. PCC 6406 TaxID=1173264 RepID=UPI0002AC59D2|nr:FGGY-family carbohydrate kinase [Leptolyngbya sp. PCC 6406]
MIYTLGLDFGTSGARAIALDAQGQIAAQVRVPFGQNSARTSDRTQAPDWVGQWRQALNQLLAEIPETIRQGTVAIACNGTSGTVLLCDATGEVIADPLLYNDDRGQSVGAILATIAPPESLVLSATSSLAKLMWWREYLPAQDWQRGRYLLHQADWLAYQFHGRLGLSDYHNALKLGYDVVALAYPDWMQRLPEARLFPQVVAPGTDWGPISAMAPLGRSLTIAAAQYGLPTHCRVRAGTTDSIAAFLASGAQQPGEAVTSLGSTLVLKLLSRTPVTDRRRGIYSHRLGNLWLVGGASNTGGAVLQHFFTSDEIERLSRTLPRQSALNLDYYPLLQPGERFPINDPSYPPRLEPRPTDPALFLQGMLEGIARIEAQGYRQLQELGATPLTRVWTAGGGAQNAIWAKIRQDYLGVPVACAPETEAAVGTARLAGGPLQSAYSG